MKKQFLLFGAAVMIVLSGCGTDNNANDANNGNSASQGEHGDHSGMNHSTSGEVPKGLKEAADPAFPVGSQAVIKGAHMEGMNGAAATIAGAYDTVVYAVSYTPTTGGERVSNHQWVIHEEIENAGAEPYKVGDEVVLRADHMEGMNGATAVIESVEQTTVYMVDFTPATGGEPVKNHKWVTESELAAK